ncbi:MAG: hypothetical protein MUO53_01980 [Maribacter sp.]|nr:hypothetical protein [Maribacter sp.]
MNQFGISLKHLILGILGFLSCACTMTNKNDEVLQKRMGAMEKGLNDTYRPGLGEFMSGIQVHHEKLWFAGTNGNWKLAQFEIDEIKEALIAIQKYSADRPETKEINMIEEPIDSVSMAIRENDEPKFKSSFQLLANTCNACHLATDHGFNVIKIPDIPSFSNQEFRLK